MKRLLLCGVLLLFCASSGGAARTPFPGSASWADSKHGWAPNTERDGLCKRTWEASGDSSLCSTEDGGRTWHVILVGGNYVSTAVRTSPQAGIVSTGAYGHVELWTRDNGKHWFATDLTGTGSLGESAPVLAGHGDQLYLARPSGDTVYQLTPWPPPESAPCAGPWSRSIVADDADPAGNVCLGPAVNAGMRSVPVATVHGTLLWLSRVPDGFFALFQRDHATELTAVVRRAGLNAVTELPAPDLPAGTPGTVQRLEIRWPSISAVGLYRVDGADGRQGEQVVWRSADGGATWDVTVQEAWRVESLNPIARTGAAAGVVGEEIVLVGGRAFFSRPGERAPQEASRVVQAYRPGEDSWRRLPDLPVAVTRAAAASAAGRLYVVGGFDARGSPRRDAFALRDGRWRRLPHAPEARAAGGAAILAGRLYVAGGVGSAGIARRMLVLDLRSGRWLSVPGPRPRAYLGVAAAGGRIVALGGRISGPATGTALVEGWRPGERRWRRLPSLPGARSDAAAVAYGGTVLTLGGAVTEYFQPLASVAVLDARRGRWDPLPDLTTPRQGLSAGVVGDRVYALAGGDDWSADDLSVANESLRLAR